MGIEENRHATEVRRRLLNPPNPVYDPGIDLKRGLLVPLPPEPLEEKPQPILSKTPLRPSHVLSFKPRDFPIMRIIESVAKHSQCSVSDILGHSRLYDISLARHISFWLCIKHFPKRSLVGLGETLNKDHSSLVHGRDRIWRLINSESQEGITVRKIIELAEEEFCGRESVITVDLPFPVSVNRIWRQGNNRVFKSAEYENWLKQAHYNWLEQRGNNKEWHIKGLYSLHLTVNPPDLRRRDLGNLEKVCSDWAQAAEIIEDDSMCRKLVIEWGTKQEAPLGARLVFRPWLGTSSSLSTGL